MAILVKHIKAHPSGRMEYRRAFAPALRPFARKAAKGYPPETVLTVRVHIMWMASLDAIIRKAVTHAVAPYVAKFRGLWVAVGSQLYTFGERP